MDKKTRDALKRLGLTDTEIDALLASAAGSKGTAWPTAAKLWGGAFWHPAMANGDHAREMATAEKVWGAAAVVVGIRRINQMAVLLAAALKKEIARRISQNG